MSLTLTLHVVPNLPPPAFLLILNRPAPLWPPQLWHRGICWMGLYETLTPTQPLCVYSCIWGVLVCELVSQELLRVYAWSRQGVLQRIHVHIECVSTDQLPLLPARCDSEAASAQTEARPEGVPPAAGPLDGTYLLYTPLITITLLKVFLNIIISMSH